MTDGGEQALLRLTPVPIGNFIRLANSRETGGRVHRGDRGRRNLRNLALGSVAPPERCERARKAEGERVVFRTALAARWGVHSSPRDALPAPTFLASRSS